MAAGRGILPADAPIRTKQPDFGGLKWFWDIWDIWDSAVPKQKPHQHSQVARVWGHWDASRDISIHTHGTRY
jgi:hypothetical protein